MLNHIKASEIDTLKHLNNENIIVESPHHKLICDGEKHTIKEKDSYLSIANGPCTCKEKENPS